jgi:hypothetical protein
MPINNLLFVCRRIRTLAAAAAMAGAMAAALASCAEVGKPGQSSAMADTPTTQQARAECWMRYEGDKKAPKDLDQRVKLVEKCVDAKLNGAPAQ